MAAAATIDSIEAGAGLGVEVRLNGTPSGTTVLKVAHSAITQPLDRVTLATTGAGTALDPLVATLPEPGMWWFWLTDNQGATQTPAFFETPPDVDMIFDLGTKVRDILRASWPALDESLQGKLVQGAPSVEGHPGQPRVAQIVFGARELTESYPAIVIDDAELDEPYGGLDFLRLVTVRFQVTAIFLHRDATTSLLDSAVALGRRVQAIFNQREHERLVTDQGRPWSFCGAEAVSISEDTFEDAYVTEARMTWSGQTTRGA